MQLPDTPGSLVHLQEALEDIPPGSPLGVTTGQGQQWEKGGTGLMTHRGNSKTLTKDASLVERGKEIISPVVWLQAQESIMLT